MTDTTQEVPIKEIPIQVAIELACAAMRSNGDYVSESTWSVSNDANFKFPNKELMLIALGEINTNKYEDYPVKPALITTNLEDRNFANEMQKYFKRLLFSAIGGEDQFKADLFAVLSKSSVPINRLGFIACLPNAYHRDKYDRAVQTADSGFLGVPGQEIFDEDCEVIKCKKSKNYDAFNIDAIINNKLTSWMGKQKLEIGPCVIIKGKVKDHSKHWHYQHVDVTRLNYVKAFQ